jgi:hypothetical protein
MLHPDDVKFLEDCNLVFDNLEARININPDVEFEMVTETVASVGNSEEQDEYTIRYAKLISPAIKPILTVTDIPTEKMLEFVADMKKGGMVDVPFEGKRMTFKHLTQEQADCLVKVFMFYQTNRAQKNTEISKEEQKQLITEIMDLDAKDGLYDTVNDTVNKMAEESWEGCDGCDEKDKYFWMSGFRAGYFRVIPDEISDEEIEKAWISYKRECLEKFEKDTTIAGYAITNKEKFAKWYREQLKQRK